MLRRFNHIWTEGLGNNLHAISDSTSPSHEGFQIWAPELVLLSPVLGALPIGIHIFKERTITPAETAHTVKLMREEYCEYFSTAAHPCGGNVVKPGFALSSIAFDQFFVAVPFFGFV